MSNETKMVTGALPMIGAKAMAELATGWTEGDGSGHEGYHVEDYFDGSGRYLGEDRHGVEPIFRDLTEAEAAQGGGK